LLRWVCKGFPSGLYLGTTALGDEDGVDEVFVLCPMSVEEFELENLIISPMTKAMTLSQKRAPSLTDC
jgi:hypothetical protein